MSDIKIEVTNLSHIYNKGTVFEKHALKNVSFQVKKGEFTAIIGHTGSGKSTLISHFNALIKPTEGRILLDGFDIHSDKSRLKEIRQRVGLVFQYPEHQLFEVSVIKDVSYGPENMGLSKDEVLTRSKDALGVVGLDESIYEKSPFELSGGQRRRVAIAGVLAMKPEVLILDEPTAGLDPKGRDEILLAIKNMHTALGINVILVSHSMEDVAKYAQRLVVLSQGELIFYDTPRAVFSEVDRLEAIGLAAPTLSYLMRSLKSQGLDVSEGVFEVEEAVNVIKDLVNRNVIRFGGVK